MKRMFLGLAAALLGLSAAYADDATPAKQKFELKEMALVPSPVVTPDVNHCLQSTGSHISWGEACVGSPGRTYGRDDFRDSGSVSWSDTLARDPSITMVNGPVRR